MDVITNDTLRSIIRDVPDFPKPGILFKDITTIFQNAEVFRYAVDQMGEALQAAGVEVLVGIESRGFIFSSALSYKLGIPFVPVRKQGKLPWRKHEVAYTLEYGQAILEIHEDSIAPGQKVGIIDDLLATGGTAEAAAQLIEKLGGKVALYSFLVELKFLKGREKLQNADVSAIIDY